MYVRSRFLTRRGVLELAMSIEACVLSWLEGGVLEHPKQPPVSTPDIDPYAAFLDYHAPITCSFCVLDLLVEDITDLHPSKSKLA